jgi:polyhydroxybutyrate depolymerase
MGRAVDWSFVAVLALVAAQAQAGTTRRIGLRYGGVERTAILYVPDSYLAGVPTPLVLVFHGGSGRAELAYQRFGVTATAEEHGFIAVFPDGLPEPGGSPRSLFWGDDVNVPFVGALLDAVGERFSVDHRRVYAAGFSGGAKLCYRLAGDPQVSPRLAAIGTVAGAIDMQPAPGAQPVVLDPALSGGRPLSAFLVQGGRDSRLPIGGGLNEQGEIHVSFDEKVATWTRFVGASQRRVAPVPQAPRRTRATRYDNPGSGIAVVALVDPTLAHAWPDWDLMGCLWGFFQGVPTR